tara:strand:- start:17090 stop:17377 length:288 start_codon:yes stop_codon:yes gene_type:complete
MKKIVYVVGMCLSFSMSSLAHEHEASKNSQVLELSKSSLENLCYLKAEDTMASYHYKASLYGLSRNDLKRTEQNYQCDSGKLLGNVVNRWSKRNT